MCHHETSLLMKWLLPCYYGNAGPLSVAHRLAVAASSQVSRCDNEKKSDGRWLLCFVLVSARSLPVVLSWRQPLPGAPPAQAADGGQQGGGWEEDTRSEVTPGERELWFLGTVNKQRDEYMLSACKMLTLLSYHQKTKARLMYSGHFARLVSNKIHVNCTGVAILASLILLLLRKSSVWRFFFLCSFLICIY